MPVMKRFNRRVRPITELSDYIWGMPLGEASYDKIDEDRFMVGFMLSDSFRERLNGERTQAIDILLDVAGLELTDSFRQWRNEQEELWLPALKIVSDVPEAEAVINSFCDALTPAVASLKLDYFDLKAKPSRIDVPTAELAQQS